MPDIYDMTTDAYPSMSQVTEELAQADCEKKTEHKNDEYVAEDQEHGIKEHMYCLDCGKELDIPEPDEDMMRGDRWERGLG